MVELTVKERFAFRFIFNEKRVYQRWYSRFLMFGTDYGRLRRVVGRISDWREWCEVWTAEGDELFRKAEKALTEGSRGIARALFHEAVACYHAGQHIFLSTAGRKNPPRQRRGKAMPRRYVYITKLRSLCGWISRIAESLFRAICEEQIQKADP